MPDLDLRQLVPLALSINTIVLMWLAGSKNVAAWVLGLAGQAGWFTFVVLFDAWGLLPLCVALTVVYARNLIRWRHEQHELDEEITETVPPPASLTPTKGDCCPGHLVWRKTAQNDDPSGDNDT